MGVKEVSIAGGFAQLLKGLKLNLAQGIQSLRRKMFEINIEVTVLL